MSEEDDLPETPPSVTTSIAAAVGPLPFLLVYAVIFISHGVFYPVEPPDITRTRTGEAVAGFAAVALALLLVWTIGWFLSGRRRWSFVIVQLGVLVTTSLFIADPNTGSPVVPVVLIVTSSIALVFAFLPTSNAHMGFAALPPRWSRFGRHRSGANPALADGSAADASAVARIE